MINRKRIKISLKEYTSKLDEIISKGHSINDTLIELLEESSKYEIKD